MVSLKRSVINDILQRRSLLWLAAHILLKVWHLVEAVHLTLNLLLRNRVEVSHTLTLMLSREQSQGLHIRNIFGWQLRRNRSQERSAMLLRH